MELNIYKDGSFKLTNNLRFNETVKSYHKDYKEEHPSIILKNKLRTLYYLFNELYEIKDTFLIFDESHKNKVFAYTKELQSFNDILLIILKVLTPPTEENKSSKEKFNYKWLNQFNKNVYKQYRDFTKVEIKLINNCSNYEKHKNKNINYIEMDTINNKTIKGFYFTSILEDNSQGADEEIHEEYMGSTTAFSINHYLLRTCGIIALNLYSLNKVIYNKESSTKKEDSYLYKIFEKLSKIEHYFFPDEYEKKAAKIAINKNGLHIKFEKYIKKQEYNISSIRPLLPAGGFDNTSSKIPYFKLLQIYNKNKKN